MKLDIIRLLLVPVLLLTACGGGEGGDGARDTDPDRPILQVRSEGGFAPAEVVYGRGPTYTLLGDGRLIYEGPVIAIYPGPLLPNYQVVTLPLQRVEEILDLVEEIGLPEMDREVDDTAAEMVADATTEVVTYWDEDGEHTYAVYALGLDPDPPRPATAATRRLMEALSEAASEGSSEEYVGDRIRIIAGISELDPDPGLEDIRPWPFPEEDPSRWERVDLGFSCRMFGPDLLDRFRDATQVTRWELPGEPGSQYVLLVRPLHPGEPACPPSPPG